MCNNTGSPPQSQKLSTTLQGSPAIDEQWDSALQVAVAKRGVPEEGSLPWKYLYEVACKAQEREDLSSAARYYQQASEALWVGNLEDASGYELPHPDMLKPILGLANIPAGIGGNDTLDAHRRLVLLCSRLMPVFEAWEYFEAKRHGRDLERVAREISETRQLLTNADQWLAPNQYFGSSTDHSMKTVRDTAEKMLVCLEEAKSLGVPLSELKMGPRLE